MVENSVWINWVLEIMTNFAVTAALMEAQKVPASPTVYWEYCPQSVSSPASRPVL